MIGIKITDLGHSSFGDVDDEVRLPKSEPWEAPEYHDRWWPLEDGKRMDVYSFGLLMLWLLFRNESFPTHNSVETKLRDAFDHGTDAGKTLQLSKRSGALLTYASQLVSSIPNISDKDRRHLHLVFDLSLQPRNKDRASDIRLLVHTLSQANSEFVTTHDAILALLMDAHRPLDRNPSITVLKAPSWHGKIQVGYTA